MSTDEIKAKVLELSKTTLDIYDVFKLYFGEENTDFTFLTKETERLLKSIDENTLESFILSRKQYIAQTITVRWPSLTIRNKNNNSIDIFDLFCSFNIDMNGNLLDVQFHRSTFTESQIMSGYVHSHIRKQMWISELSNRLSIKSYLNCFCGSFSFCFGSGPVLKTISKLRSYFSNNFDPFEYMLLCREIDLCVRIESLDGGPYIRISDVGIPDSEYKETNISGETLNLYMDFVRYCLKNANFKFVFQGDKYSFSESFYEFAVRVTKMFIEYVKEKKDSIDNGFVKDSIISIVKKGGKHMFTNFGRHKSLIKDVINSENMKVIDFKGKEYCLKMIDDAKTTSNIMLLRNDVVAYIRDIVLLIVNSKVNNEERDKEQKPTECDAELCNENKTMRYEFISGDVRV